MLLKGLKKITPPIFIDIIRFFRQNKKKDIEWRGNYASWQEASKNSGGYDAENILNQCQNALLKVKKGEAVYERDGFVFNEIQYSWAVLALLQRAAIENKGALCVVDFGGSLGSSYFQNKAFLEPIKDLKWCAVRSTSRTSSGLSLSLICPSVQSLHSIRKTSPGLTETTAGISGCQRLCPGSSC